MIVKCTTGDSPIYDRQIIYDIGNILIKVAPERAKDIGELIKDLNLEITNSGEFICRIFIKEKHIEISRKCLEHLWCCSYAYWMLYDIYLSGKKIDKPADMDIDLTIEPQVKSAMQLLNWTFNNIMKKQDLPWPTDLPRPVGNPVPLSSEHVANRLMLYAVAFFLHHELAHHRLSHTELPESSDSIDQERDADYEAAHWILASCQGEEFQKRSIGIAIALSCLVAHRIHYGEDIAITHPRTFDRLINTLQRHIHDPDHASWGFSVAVLSLHLTNVGISIPKYVFDSAKDAAEYFASMLAERRRSPLS